MYIYTETSTSTALPTPSPSLISSLLTTAPPTTLPTEPRPNPPSSSPATEEPTARALTGNQESYQIILIVEGVIVAVLLVSIVFTCIAVIVTSSKRPKNVTENFAYTTWSPDVTDKDAGRG